MTRDENGPAPRLAAALLGMLLGGCIPGVGGGVSRQDASPAPFPDCVAASYEFVGEGTFNALGLVDAVPAPPPTPDRTAMIWVTRDLLPFDHGQPGGPVEMTRMMCFEFPDGTGGSQWPVDPSWRLPALAGVAPEGVSLSPGLVLVALAVLLAIAVSALAFRSRR